MTAFSVHSLFKNGYSCSSITDPFLGHSFHSLLFLEYPSQRLSFLNLPDANIFFFEAVAVVSCYLLTSFDLDVESME